MPMVEMVNRMPLWGLFLLTLVLVLACLEIGFRMGRARLRRSAKAADEPVGAIVGAILGLLAFMLAFTFGIASGRFETRKRLLLDEVNAIGTASLRAGLLSEPHRGEIQRLFREYVDLRVELARHPERRTVVLSRTEALQREMWSHAVTLAQEDRDSDIYAIFIESLNEVIDLHTSRVTVAFQYRIPEAIWLTLYLLTMVSMAAVGHQFGLAGRRAFVSGVGLAIAFSAVLLLVADLDRVSEGALQVSQQPMLELQRTLHAGERP